jgi:hypothetical protein
MFERGHQTCQKQQNRVVGKFRPSFYTPWLRCIAWSANNLGTVAQTPLYDFPSSPFLFRGFDSKKPRFTQPCKAKSGHAGQMGPNCPRCATSPLDPPDPLFQPAYHVDPRRSYQLPDSEVMLDKHFQNNPSITAWPDSAIHSLWSRISSYR